jgi:S-adenosylmethionine decarboxylase
MEKHLDQSVSGTHCLLELYGCPYKLMNDEQFVRDAILKTADKASARILNICSHKFDPQGVTALALLAESHLSIHTWPQHGYAAADMFTCGHMSDPKTACLVLVGLFQAERHTLKVIERGTVIRHQALHSLYPYRDSDMFRAL